MDFRSGSPTALQEFLASSASRCACRRGSRRLCASGRDDDGSMRKRASSCLGVCGREHGAVDPFPTCYKCIPHFCRTAQGCQVLLSGHRRSSSGCRKGWSTVQKLHAIMHARLVLAAHREQHACEVVIVFQVGRAVLLEACGLEETLLNTIWHVQEHSWDLAEYSETASVTPRQPRTRRSQQYYPHRTFTPPERLDYPENAS